MSDTSPQVYNPATGVAFKVTDVKETAGQDSTGRYVAGKQVSYQLKSGLTGTVFVPDSQWNEDTVRAAVTKAAATLQNVSMIQQGM